MGDNEYDLWRYLWYHLDSFSFFIMFKAYLYNSLDLHLTIKIWLHVSIPLANKNEVIMIDEGESNFPVQYLIL